MSKIKVMDDLLASKIAAGEVIESPYNVVKELIENSIDAFSDKIIIELKSSGVKEIKVIDNGIGMDREDAKLCFLPHATSKIKTINDLNFVETLGFRGEALSSIASISKVSMYTSNGKTSTNVSIEGGKNLVVEEGTIDKGTIIVIKDLFYNMPARYKFLKSLNTELNQIIYYVQRLALSKPNISFELYNDDKELLHTTNSNDLLKTIHEIYGLNTSKNMVYIESENYDYQVNGYISNINIQRSNKKGLITIVNGRIINNYLINNVIKDAYHSFMFDNKYPLVVINIITDPTLIDVNIHPTKQDIKFSSFDELENLVFKTIRDALNNMNNSYNFFSNDEEEEIVVKENNDIKYENVQMSFNDYTIKESSTSLIKPIGIVWGTFLIATEEDIMYLIDYHAANERINYEKTLKQMKERKTSSIDLLIPIVLEYSKDDYLIIKNNIDFIESLGFDIEEFGINTYRVISHPTYIKEGREEEDIKSIFDEIISMGSKFDINAFYDNACATLACKSSVKANTMINNYEQEELINRLFKCDNPYTCAHGRPIVIKYTKHELEKIFKRIV